MFELYILTTTAFLKRIYRLVFKKVIYKKYSCILIQETSIIVYNTVQSRFSDTLFSDKSRFSDNFAEDHFLVHKNISFSDNLVFSATPI